MSPSSSLSLPHVLMPAPWQVVLAADRLCYAPSPDPEEEARYIPLDRVPVRAMPRGYAPGIGAGLVDDRHLDPGGSRAAGAGCVFSVACGSHVHLFAASSPEDAQVWGSKHLSGALVTSRVGRRLQAPSKALPWLPSPPISTPLARWMISWDPCASSPLPHAGLGVQDLEGVDALLPGTSPIHVSHKDQA